MDAIDMKTFGLMAAIGKIELDPTAVVVTTSIKAENRASAMALTRG